MPVPLAVRAQHTVGVDKPINGMCPHGGFHHFGAEKPLGDSEFLGSLSKFNEHWLFGYTKDGQLNGNAGSRPIMVGY